MKQNTFITVNSEKPLSQLGDNHILAYDKANKCYNAVTIDKILTAANAEIATMKKQVANIEKQIAIFEKGMSKKETDFENKINTEKNEFLAQYKETNSKIIEMVKSFTNKGE